MEKLLNAHNLKRYQAFALVAFNTFVAIATINALIPKKQSPALPHITKWPVTYTEFAPGQRQEIKSEFNADTAKYAPFAVFSPKPFSGKWLHVTPQSFRRTNDNECWPPDPKDLNVFVFGSSTTMGAGITDDQTIPAYMREPLQERMAKKVRVYNFGMIAYISTQERILFSHMMANGIRPDVAVFICGTTDFDHSNDEPNFVPRMRLLMQERGSDLLVTTRRFLTQLPLAKLAMRARKSLNKGGTNDEQPDQEQSGTKTISDKQVDEVIHRYMENKRLAETVAAIYKVKTLFVWQPNPNYKFDQKHHPYTYGDGRETGEAHGYTKVAKMLKDEPEEFGNNFLWLADMQQEATEPLYVDAGHYRPKFCKAVAVEIAQRLLQQTLIADAPHAVPQTGRQ